MSQAEDKFRQDLIALLPRLRRFACGLTGSMDRADDLVQDACERAMTRFHQWKPGSRLDSWVFTIMRSIWVNRLNADRVRRGEGLEEAEDLPAPNGEKRIEARLLLTALDRKFAELPADWRSLVLLVYGEGYSYREAAEILDLPVGTVMSRLSRARLSLIQESAAA